MSSHSLRAFSPQTREVIVKVKHCVLSFLYCRSPYSPFSFYALGITAVPRELKAMLNLKFWEVYKVSFMYIGNVKIVDFIIFISFSDDAVMFLETQF